MVQYHQTGAQFRVVQPHCCWFPVYSGSALEVMIPAEQLCIRLNRTPLRTTTHSSGSSVKALISWCGTNGGNEPAGLGFGGDFPVGAPPHPGPAADHIDHALQLAVMMGPWAAVLRLR